MNINHNHNHTEPSPIIPSLLLMSCEQPGGEGDRFCWLAVNGQSADSDGQEKEQT